MNKTLKAMLMGFVLFKVNGKSFFLYNSALADKDSTVGNINFKGFSIFRGWRFFCIREEYTGEFMPTTHEGEMKRAVKFFGSEA